MIELRAPAKLTLSLRVLGRRDDGYHLIEGEMVGIDLFDVLEVDPDGNELVIIRGDRERAGGRDDLVNRALRHCGRTAAVRLHKNIPVGAGLGGGSADAAAILRWSGHTDLEEAATIGADVPFCLVGGRARVTGMGERVEPLPFEPRTFTLLTPSLHCATAVVFRSWDELSGPKGANGNDLEPAALAAFPELSRWREQLRELSGAEPRLAGSGSTWFVEGAHEGPDLRVVKTMPA